MPRLRKSLQIVALLGLAASAYSQGSAGGYGQGGQGGGGGFGGGGFGGGSMNRPNAPGSARGDFDEGRDKRKVDEDETRGLWESKTAILTPGDRVEFKFKLRKGETLMATATSDAFDPALSVFDAQGKELAKNDDRAEGDQSPFVIYRVPEEGTYTLKVLSFRSVSGGKFTAKMRTFVSTEAGLGAITHDSVTPIETEGNDHIVFRIAGKKGKVYDLRPMFATAPGTLYGISLSRVIGPTGVESSDFQSLPNPTGSMVFKALADGDYYIEYEGMSNTKRFRFMTDYREVAVIQAQATGKAPIPLDKGELKIIEFPVKEDQVIRTVLKGSDIDYSLSSPAAGNAIADVGDRAYGNNRFWLWFKLNCDSDKDVVRVFHGTGTARIAIRSSAKAAQQVAFENSESVPTWNTGDATKGALEIGDTKLFLIKSTKSELMRVRAEASHFQPKLDIFRLSGELANSLQDRKTHTAGDDLYFPDEGTFVVRLTCDGYGGSGDYTMKRDSLNPALYALGTAQTMKLDGGNFGLYSVNLEAGKRYVLMSDDPDSFLRTDLLDDDGQFLISQRIRFDKVEVQYFVPTKSGRHRLWLRGEPGVRHFKFELHVPPTVGGTP